jgi:HAD superfamily hydrolase (TIGR01549 family)
MSEFHFDGIKAVGFDFDNTLVDEPFSVRERWKAVLRQFARLSPNGDLSEKFFEIYAAKGLSYKRHVNDALEALKIDPNWVAPIVQAFLSTVVAERLHDGALELLRWLQQSGYALGILTNGRQKTQSERIRISGVSDYMQHVVYSDDHQKPAKQGFERFIEKLGLESGRELLYVGNSYEEDILGARAVGAKACWISKENLSVSSGISLDGGVLIVESFQELLQKFTAWKSR